MRSLSLTMPMTLAIIRHRYSLILCLISTDATSATLVRWLIVLSPSLS
jgi:hypothetical protein